MKCNTDVEIAVNGWPQFDCTSIRLRDHIGLGNANFLLAGSQEGVENFLMSSTFDKNDTIQRSDDETSGYLSNVKRSWPYGLQEKDCESTKTYFFPDKIEDLAKWSCPENAYVAKLKAENMKFICGFWKYGKLEDRITYFEGLREKCGSIGIFLKDSPSQPVSWALCSKFGHIKHLYTLPEHQGKGYAKITVLSIMKDMMEIGVTPELEIVDTGNIVAVKLFSELGFVESHSAKWKLLSYN
ncbi:uncharacterized protein [Dysidea avara]